VQREEIKSDLKRYARQAGIGFRGLNEEIERGLRRLHEVHRYEHQKMRGKEALRNLDFVRKVAEKPMCAIEK